MGALPPPTAELRLLRHGWLRYSRDPRRYRGHAQSLRHVLSARNAFVARRALVDLQPWTAGSVGGFGPVADPVDRGSPSCVASRAAPSVPARRGHHRRALRDLASLHHLRRLLPLGDPLDRVLAGDAVARVARARVLGLE